MLITIIVTIAAVAAGAGAIITGERKQDKPVRIPVRVDPQRRRQH